VVWKSAGLLAILLVPSTASGQSFFVQGGGGREIKRFSGEPENAVFDATATVVVIGVSGYVRPHWTLGVELDLGGRSATSRTTSVTVSGRLRDIHTQYTLQRRSASALIGYQTSAHHAVQVGYYAGLSFSTVTREIASDADTIVLQTPPAASIYRDRVVGAVAGVDVAIRVAPHVAIVPALRAQGLALGGDLNGHSIRPSLGARISF
jgi:hypothetical protein